MVTPEKVQYIIEHINDRPRTQLAEKLGINIGSLYNIIRKYGGAMDYSLSTRNKEVVKCVKRYYPTKTAREIARAHGFSVNAVQRWARRLSIKHTSATLARIYQKRAQAARNLRTRVDYAMLAKKRRRLYRQEWERVWQGKPQLTHLQIAQTTKRAYKAKWKLVNKYHYMKHPTDPYALFITTDTHRINEEHYIQRYKLKFLLYDTTVE